ncbi:MAG: hypothetical protein C4527_04640 [Candidatus Omnitrophota bacterium]|jgi:VIT1/CCC1 family predicted Fe2+/Mn2+ transporter|nr:MAG: hypothetical protein C4527_04640 [Candidatus Omnitrophota bacterium]
MEEKNGSHDCINEPVNRKSDVIEKKPPTGKKTDEKEPSIEIVEKMPGNMRDHFFALISKQLKDPFSFGINEKLTEEHINKIIDYTEKDNERNYRFADSARKYHLIYTVIGVLLFVFLTWFLSTNSSAVYSDILKMMAIFAGGLGAGYGIKSAKK